MTLATASSSPAVLSSLSLSCSSSSLQSAPVEESSGSSSGLPATGGQGTTTIVSIPSSLVKPNVNLNVNGNQEDCEQTQTTSPTMLEDYEEEDESEEGDLQVEQEQNLLQQLQLQQHSTLKPHGRTAPVIKPYDLSQVPTTAKRWMSLKMPPDAQIQQLRLTRSVSAPVSAPASAPATCTDQQERRRSVSFVAVHIREYQQTMGDNPSCSYGPPVSLDWNFVENDAVPLDDYETNRGKRRTLRQMMLNYYHRTNLLKHYCGYSDAELTQAHKAAERVKSQRAMTKALLGVSKLEEVWQSTKRKTQRLAGKKKKDAAATAIVVAE